MTYSTLQDVIDESIRLREARERHEPLVNKRALARHLNYSERWVELRVKDGMPHLRVGGQLRFRISEVEAYFRDREDRS